MLASLLVAALALAPLAAPRPANGSDPRKAAEAAPDGNDRKAIAVGKALLARGIQEQLFQKALMERNPDILATGDVASDPFQKAFGRWLVSDGGALKAAFKVADECGYYGDANRKRLLDGALTGLLRGSLGRTRDDLNRACDYMVKNGIYDPSSHDQLAYANTAFNFLMAEARFEIQSADCPGADPVCRALGERYIAGRDDDFVEDVLMPTDYVVTKVKNQDGAEVFRVSFDERRMRRYPVIQYPIRYLLGSLTIRAGYDTSRISLLQVGERSCYYEAGKFGGAGDCRNAIGLDPQFVDLSTMKSKYDFTLDRSSVRDPCRPFDGLTIEIPTSVYKDALRANFLLTIFSAGDRLYVDNIGKTVTCGEFDGTDMGPTIEVATDPVTRGARQNVFKTPGEVSAAGGAFTVRMSRHLACVDVQKPFARPAGALIEGDAVYAFDLVLERIAEPGGAAERVCAFRWDPGGSPLAPPVPRWEPAGRYRLDPGHPLALVEKGAPALDATMVTGRRVPSGGLVYTAARASDIAVSDGNVVQIRFERRIPASRPGRYRITLTEHYREARLMALEAGLPGDPAEAGVPVDAEFLSRIDLTSTVAYDGESGAFAAVGSAGLDGTVKTRPPDAKSYRLAWKLLPAEAPPLTAEFVIGDRTVPAILSPFAPDILSRQVRYQSGGRAEIRLRVFDESPAADVRLSNLKLAFAPPTDGPRNPCAITARIDGLARAGRLDGISRFEARAPETDVLPCFDKDLALSLPLPEDFQGTLRAEFRLSHPGDTAGVELSSDFALEIPVVDRIPPMIEVAGTCQRGVEAIRQFATNYFKVSENGADYFTSRFARASVAQGGEGHLSPSTQYLFSRTGDAALKREGVLLPFAMAKEGAYVPYRVLEGSEIDPTSGSPVDSPFLLPDKATGEKMYTAGLVLDAKNALTLARGEGFGGMKLRLRDNLKLGQCEYFLCSGTGTAPLEAGGVALKTTKALDGAKAELDLTFPVQGSPFAYFPEEGDFRLAIRVTDAGSGNPKTRCVSKLLIPVKVVEDRVDAATVSERSERMTEAESKDYGAVSRGDAAKVEKLRRMRLSADGALARAASGDIADPADLLDAWEPK